MDLPSTSARYRATILFCDVREFTALFNERDPFEAVEFANTVLVELGHIVEKSNGSIDKFTGDGFLAHFGIEGENVVAHAEDACRCALRLIQRLIEINSQREIVNQPVIQIGIGIHTGDVATGTIATSRKSEFTVLGGVVNMASRIESLTKYFSVDCLVSEVTMSAVGAKFEFQKMPAKALRGVSQSSHTYWLLPTNAVEPV
jgi:adenylate cyclase